MRLAARELPCTSTTHRRPAACSHTTRARRMLHVHTHHHHNHAVCVRALTQYLPPPPYRSHPHAHARRATDGTTTARTTRAHMQHTGMRVLSPFLRGCSLGSDAQFDNRPSCSPGCVTVWSVGGWPFAGWDLFGNYGTHGCAKLTIHPMESVPHFYLCGWYACSLSLGWEHLPCAFPSCLQATPTYLPSFGHHWTNLGMPALSFWIMARLRTTVLILRSDVSSCYGFDV